MPTQTGNSWLSTALRGGLAVLFLWMVRAELIPVALGALFALLLTPLQRRLVGRGGFFGRHAAILLTLGAIVCVIVPLVAIAARVVVAANDFLSMGLPEIADKLEAFLAEHFSGLAAQLHLPVENLQRSAMELAKRVGTGLAAVAGDVASSLPAQIVNLFLFTLALYYFLRDGEAFVAWLVKLSPFPKHDTEELFASIRETVLGAIVGQLVTSLVQGGLTLIALWIFGVPGALVLAIIATLLSILPMLGTTPITLGATLYLIASGSFGAAIGMGIAAILIGVSDNIVRPWVQSSQTKMHPLVTLIAIFGGLSTFGASGVFLGPVIAAMAIWNIEFYAKFRDREIVPTL